MCECAARNAVEVVSAAEIVQAVVEFIGPELLPNPDQMLDAIDPSLYRKRTTETR